MNLINQEDLNKALHNLRMNAVANAEQFQNAEEVLGTILSVEYIAHHLPVYTIDDALARLLFQPEDEDDEQDDVPNVVDEWEKRMAKMVGKEKQ